MTNHQCSVHNCWVLGKPCKPCEQQRQPWGSGRVAFRGDAKYQQWASPWCWWPIWPRPTIAASWPQVFFSSSENIPWPWKTIPLQPRWLEGRLLHIVQLRDLRLSTRHHHRHPPQDIYALKKVADTLILREVFVQCQNGENGGRKCFPNYESLEQRGLIKTFSNLSHLCIKDSTFLIWFLLVSWGTSSNSHIPL